MGPGEIHDWLAGELPALIARHRVPAAAVAVDVGGETAEAAAGLLNTATGVEATTDSLFQIGSIGKVWTATLVMQLVEDGSVDLDAPVDRYVPEFRLGGTVRQLLSHTGGFEGDIFIDTGRGDDCLEKYVAALGDVPRVFPAGERFSYNNAGFCVLGRLVEVLRGKNFDECVREYLCRPLGLTHTATSADEAIMFRAAVGHVEGRPAPVWALARSGAPAGSMLAMRARDLTTFARGHLTGGVLLGDAGLRAMREPQIGVPALGLFGDDWGLGWEVFDHGVLGHDGSTVGQSAFLRVVPDRGVSVALLTNGGDSFALYRDVVGHVMREVAGIELPAQPTPPESPDRGPATRQIGSYTCSVAELTVSQDDDGRIWLEERPRGVFADLGDPVERYEMVPYDADTLISTEAEGGAHRLYVFLGDDGHGRAAFLHNGRALPRAVG